MSAEKFLIKLFGKFSESDFQSDDFLNAFYKFFKKEKSDNLFKCYIEYLVRNNTFNDINHRNAELKKIYEEIRNNILYKDEDANTNIGFITDNERNETSERQKMQTDSVDVANTLFDPNLTSASKKIIKLNKAKALRIISLFIKQSHIITYEEPDETTTKEDQFYRELTTNTIVDEIKNIEGRSLPDAKKDIDFGRRVDMLNIWHDTEHKCKELAEDKNLNALISKVFFIETSQLLYKADKISTVNMKEINEVLPVETFSNCYTNIAYKTRVYLTNTHPIEETVNRARNKIKTIYICAGSQMVLGGNADQGMDVNESMPYITSTYNIGIEKALHAFPLSNGQILLCPNVLVFKDINYQMLPIQKWQRIAIMNAPSKWRPKLKFNDNADAKPEIDLFNPKIDFARMDDITSMENIITGMLETALFFGYDTIILDDRAIEYNNLPAYAVAKILQTQIKKFDNRIKEVVICANKPNSYKVFKNFFPM